MSRTVREEVTPKSNERGHQLGSIYIRKVHFRDPEMIRQIESKVVMFELLETQRIEDGEAHLTLLRKADRNWRRAGALLC